MPLHLYVVSFVVHCWLLIVVILTLRLQLRLSRLSLYQLLLHHFVLLSSAAAQDLHQSHVDDHNTRLTKRKDVTAAELAPLLRGQSHLVLSLLFWWTSRLYFSEDVMPTDLDSATLKADFIQWTLRSLMRDWKLAHVVGSTREPLPALSFKVLGGSP